MNTFTKRYEEMNPVERAIFNEVINRPVTPIVIKNFKHYEDMTPEEQADFDDAINRASNPKTAETAETAKDLITTEAPALRTGSMELVPVMEYVAKRLPAEYEYKRWLCNKACTTIYINKKLVVEVLVGRTIRINAKKALRDKLADFEYKEAATGSGMNLTKTVEAGEMLGVIKRVIEAAVN